MIGGAIAPRSPATDPDAGRPVPPLPSSSPAAAELAAVRTPLSVAEPAAPARQIRAAWEEGEREMEMGGGRRWEREEWARGRIKWWAPIFVCGPLNTSAHENKVIFACGCVKWPAHEN
uniref:Uncharacterized protein n=1 Tax=Oryza sativa subsp. japonica TaxID=39947 RepID=Q67V80_ORYSJ|nr:hypothetical protein [Oryza sativa Japonica Group]